MSGDTPGVAAQQRAADPDLPLLIALAALGAAAMNLLLPALPAIEGTLGDGRPAVHAALTAFLVGSALAQLAAGPLGQRLGSRRLLAAGLLVFTLGSGLAGIAPTIETLALGRLLQGTGGAISLTLAEAITAATMREAALVRRMACLNTGMAGAILLAPVTGAILGSVLDWRAICWATAAAGLLLFSLCRRGIDRSAECPRPATPAVASPLRSRRFVTNGLCAAFVMANYFCLAAFGPLICIRQLGLSERQYGLLFAGLGIGYILGNLASSRLGERYGQRRATTAALAVMLGSGLLGAVLIAIDGPSVASFLATGVAVAAATGMVMPAATGAALGDQGPASSTAAGLLNFAIFAVGATTTQVVGSQIEADATMAMAALPFVTAIAFAAHLAGGAPTVRPHAFSTANR